MPTTSKPKRMSLSISLPPELAARLQREADQRLIAPSLLVEKALAPYLAALPPIDA